MKGKNKELKKFSDEELLAEIISRSGSTKGLPTKTKCFKCSKDFWIKWNQTTQVPSKLHSWEYWTDKKTKDKICGSCLRSLYSNKSDFWTSVKDLKKRKILSGYVSNILG